PEREPCRRVVDLQLLLARARAPQANGAIAGARREPAVGTELKGADRVRVAPKDGRARTGVDVPEAHALVLAAARQPLRACCRVERHSEHLAGMAAQGEQFLAGGSVPQLYGLVRRRGGQASAIGPEGDAGNAAGVSAQRQQDLARFRLADFQTPA